jgi:predicted RNA-binding Zn-ribbon protein involved in translation (DUF1610 family)
MFCPYCGKENADDARFCLQCGKELSTRNAEVHCPHCGKENVATAKFCYACGKNLMLLPDLGKMHICLLIFLTVITFGMYYPIWFLIKRRGLNELQSSIKIGLVTPIFVIVIWSIKLLFQFTSGFVEGLGYIESAEGLNIITGILSLIGGIILIVQGFRVRRIFIDHFNVYLRRDIKFSGIATFFFGIFYLQYKINRF